MSERTSDAEWGKALWDWIRERLSGGGCFVGFDPEDLMKLAEKHGRARKVRYHPDVHGEFIEAEPGEEIWWWGDDQEGKS